MKGYLVRRVYVDQGASVEVTFEHCFENLRPAIRSRLRGTQMDLVGFTGGVVKPLGKIKLEVVFGDGGLFRTVMINFTVVRALSPYNVIFGRTGLRSLRAVSSTIHSMETNGPTGGQSEYQPRERSSGKSGFDRTSIGQPNIPGLASNNRGKPIGTITRRTKKKGSGIRQNPGRKQESGRMGECRNSSFGEIPYMDIKPGAYEEKRWKLEDVHRLQKYQLGMPKRLLHPMRIRDTIRCRWRRTTKKKLRSTWTKARTATRRFGLKNAGTTYQRLVDTAFQSHIGRNLKAYVDDMVIKINDEKVLIEDIPETFDNLRRINMKLNPKKCSFGVKEGKFLGYMVTSKGIRANPKKTKAIADMQSPWTLKEMQSLSGKLAALKRFLSRDEKGHSRVAIANHPSKGRNAIRIRGSGNGGRKCRVASRKKGETMSDTLRGYEGKLAKYSVELGAYNITYEPRNAMKGQVLVDFLSETPVGTPTEEFFRLPAGLPNKDDVERWTLFIDGALNSKGSGAGLVLISPSGLEFTYALRLNFASTNNEAEYEALLAGLRMARNMKVQNIDVKVDSKLVASQINRNYMTSSTNMIKYLATIKECIAEFKTFAIQNIPRNLNQKADILSKLATHAFDHLTKKVLVEVLAERSTDRKEVGEIVEEEEDNWMTPIIRCLAEGVPLHANYVIREIHVGWNAHRGKVRGGESYKTGILLADYAQGRQERNAKNVTRARANKSLMEGIKVRLGRERAGWVDELPNVLWAHRTSLKQSNGETSFSLTYGSEAVIPAEIGMPTQRTMMIREDENEDELRLNMDLLQ
ncbi:reverse transcriptase domain-containing protein [Tanacetum coccineum]|uniref:Reverse transcriptase domain-containing protein n=1 Tax=Tanacetum coccineum TaxID=301880 RepID=A0ABQ5HTF6_9ASTR